MVMSEFEANESEVLAGSGPHNHRRRRGVYLLPGFFTVANMLCGFYAVLATFEGGQADFDKAAKAIGIAILFDSIDGFVARATGTNTEFGKQFDSLADVISFGIAPAFLAYAWGVRAFMQGDPGPARHVYQLGWLVSLAFVICCAWRLARFNVHGMTQGGRYFVGLPTPAAAGMIAATVHARKAPLEDWRWAVAWLALVAGLAALMTSTVRYYSFKNIPWTRRQPSLALVVIGLLVWSIVVYSEEVLLLIAGSYAAVGVALHVVRVVRHRLVSRPA
jgi:CDP-diacylglycerol--serine O-phosphatidyltransferase